MPIEFQINEKDDVVLITTTGNISEQEIIAMRIKTLEVLNETGIQNFVVDMTYVDSFLEQSTAKTYEMGKEFVEMEFPLSMRTAVILPISHTVKKQAELLHLVEINRARPELRYVSSYEEALDWFRSKR